MAEGSHAHPGGGDASDLERRTYEEECLHALRKRGPTICDRKTVRAMRLEGEYPLTRLAVRWEDRGEERFSYFHFWINPLSGRPPGSAEWPEGDGYRRESPYEFALLAYVDMLES